jgi:hypothetical protein
MITKLILLFIFPLFLLLFNDDDKYMGLTKSEVKYVKNLERMETEKLQKVYKVDSDRLMVEFGSIKYLINTTSGFAESVWVLSEDDVTWEDLGPEY